MEQIKTVRKQFFWFVFSMTIIFLLSVLFGYWMAITNSEDIKQVVKQLFSQFSFVRNLNIFLVFLFIFLNNAIKGFLVMISGIFFGISPVIFIFINGELIGLVMGASNDGGVGAGKILLSILPHGILEIPAIILSASYGLWLGYRFYRSIGYSDPFKIYFAWALKNFVIFVVPLLLFAAFIETFITPFIISRITK